MTRAVHLPDEAATLALGAEFAQRGLARELVLLHGDLGAGKTTFARGLLRALGHVGAVKSPTYTLLESYELGGGRVGGREGSPLRVYHFDFYRIVDPGELVYMGIDELMAADAVKLVEWPGNAGGHLPPADIEVHLEAAGDGRRAGIADHR